MIGTPAGAVRRAGSGGPQDSVNSRRGCEGARRRPGRCTFRWLPILTAPMRRSLVVPLALLAACGAPTPEPAPAPEAAAEPVVVTDSLVRSEPAVNYRVAIGFPRIEGDERPAARRVNAAVRDSVEAFAESLRPDPGFFTGDAEADRIYVGDADGGPARTFLGGRVFSSRVDVYAYTGGAHGNLYSFAFNYDLATGEPFGLGDLFLGGTAYLDTLAARTTERLVAARGTGWMFDDAIPPDPAYFSLFTLGPDSLTVFFPPYAIAPYAAGPSEVSLPYAALRGVLDDGGPVGWVRKRRGARP